jgi:hypothetical protein
MHGVAWCSNSKPDAICLNVPGNIEETFLYDAASFI